MNWLSLLVVLVLSGCATPALWNAAEGLGEAELKLEILQVRSAYKNETGGVEVCIQARDLESQTVRDVTLSIPVENTERLRVRTLTSQDGDLSVLSQNSAQAVHVEFRPEPPDIVPGCRNAGRPITLLQTKIRPKICDPDQEDKRTSQMLMRLPPDTTEAVYYMSLRGTPENIGYLSTRPIVPNGHGIDVPASYLRSVRPHGDANPYLYLLTPVTVAVDAAIVAVVAVVIAHNPPSLKYSCTP